MSVVAINPTSVRIRFTLPDLLVGRMGHTELHYTTDSNTPRSQWNVQKFELKRSFETSRIKYYLGNLSPGTTYFFQIQVIIEELQSESEIYKLHLPPIPSSATASTTITTVPPMIMLGVQLNAISNDYSLNGKTVSSNAIKLTTKEKPPKTNKIDTSGQFICSVLDKSSKYLCLFELELILFCFSQIPKPIANETEVLTENEVMDTRHFFSFDTVPAWSIAGVAVIGFVILLYCFIRKKPTTKVSITRTPSESPHETIKLCIFVTLYRRSSDNIPNRKNYFLSKRIQIFTFNGILHYVLIFEIRL